MITKQKIAILGVLFAICYLLFAIGRYWLADVYYASGQNQLRAFAATSNTQYLSLALGKLLSAYKLNPNEPFIASELSTAAAYVGLLIKDKQYISLAINTSDTSIRISPYHPNFYKTRAKMFIVLSQFDMAVKTLEQAAKISPTDPRIPYTLGVVYKYLNATDSAKLAFQQALYLKPDFAEAKKQLLIPTN